MTPASLDFGSIAAGSDSTANLTIANTGAADLVVNSITSDDAHYTALPANLVVPPGSSGAIAVQFAPDTGGALAATLELLHNDPDSPTRLDLTGTATVTSVPVQITPASIDFGHVKYGDVGASSLQLINGNSSPVTISSIGSSDPQFSCAVSSTVLAPGETQSVALSFNATSLGTKTATLSIQQSGVSQPLTLPLRADATVGLNISRLDFGSIQPGKAAFLPLRIDNPSGAPVTISSILSDNPKFVPDCTTCVIPAGDSQTIYVTFTPTDTKPQSARLSITHNPTLIVNISANGFNRDFSQVLDAGGKPLQTMAVPFGGEWLAALLICLYAATRRRLT